MAHRRRYCNKRVASEPAPDVVHARADAVDASPPAADSVHAREDAVNGMSGAVMRSEIGIVDTALC